MLPYIDLYRIEAGLWPTPAALRPTADGDGTHWVDCRRIVGHWSRCPRRLSPPRSAMRRRIFSPAWSCWLLLSVGLFWPCCRHGSIRGRAIERRKDQYTTRRCSSLYLVAFPLSEFSSFLHTSSPGTRGETPPVRFWQPGPRCRLWNRGQFPFPRPRCRTGGRSGGSGNQFRSGSDC
jgi:hypothetical protein